MKSFSDRFMAHLDSMGWKPYDVWKSFKSMPEEDRLSEQYIYALCRGDKQPKDDKTLQKLTAIKELGLSIDTLRAWQKLGTASEAEKIEIINELLSGDEAQAEIDLIHRENFNQAFKALKEGETSAEVSLYLTEEEHSQFQTIKAYLGVSSDSEVFEYLVSHTANKLRQAKSQSPLLLETLKLKFKSATKDEKIALLQMFFEETEFFDMVSEEMKERGLLK